MIEILLVGNYSIFRNALRMLIEAEKNLKVIGETADLVQAGELISGKIPDLLLVDLPEGETNEVFSFLEQEVARCPVLLLAGAPDAETYHKCLRLGISGLVLKEKSAEVLFKAIEKVCQGEIWFERAVMGQMIQYLVNEKVSPEKKAEVEMINSLTEREKQVVDLICQGLKNKGIAEKLFITETTVRHHLTSIFNKLEITSRLELVIYAFRHNLAKLQNTNGGSSGNGGGKTSALSSGFGNGFKSLGAINSRS